MGIIDDPISGVLGAFFTRAIESKVWNRLELMLELAIAATVSGFAAAGAALLAQQPVAWSVGAGLLAAAVAMFATFQASPNSKGLVISVQQKVAQDKIADPTTTIERK